MDELPASSQSRGQPPLLLRLRPEISNYFDEEDQLELWTNREKRKENILRKLGPGVLEAHELKILKKRKRMQTLQYLNLVPLVYFGRMLFTHKKHLLSRGSDKLLFFGFATYSLLFFLPTAQANFAETGLVKKKYLEGITDAEIVAAGKYAKARPSD